MGAVVKLLSVGFEVYFPKEIPEMVPAEALYNAPCFFIHRKELVVIKCECVGSYESKKPSGQDAHLAEKKQNAIHTGTYERCCCAAVPGATLRSAF